MQVTSLALMMFLNCSLFQRGFGPRGEGQVWGALQQREREGQGVVCEIRERPGKGSAGQAAGILHGLCNRDLFISQRSIFGRQELEESEEPQQSEIDQ